MIGKVSFPQGRTSDIRAYTRKGLLRGQVDEVDYTDDDDVEDEPEDGWTETSDELVTWTPEVDVETEDEGFD
jgi:hypothetical protein